MPRTVSAAANLPAELQAGLARLGEDLALARVRRKESQRDWAGRIGVSVPTLIRMERGDSTVSMAVYATALWMIGRTQALASLADPAEDLGALELDVRGASRQRAVRAKASVAANLARKTGKP